MRPFDEHGKTEVSIDCLFNFFESVSEILEYFDGSLLREKVKHTSNVSGFFPADTNTLSATINVVKNSVAFHSCC